MSAGTYLGRLYSRIKSDPKDFMKTVALSIGSAILAIMVYYVALYVLFLMFSSSLDLLSLS